MSQQRRTAAGISWRGAAMTLAAAVAVAAMPPAAAQQKPLPARPRALPQSAADATDAAALSTFHTRLAELEKDRSGERARLNVIQIGDSHTAADHFSGRLRQLLQARFGNGGRGMLPAGAPHDYYRPYQVSVGQSGKWQMLTSNKPNPDQVRFGLAGTIARATAAGDTMTIVDRSGAHDLGIGYFWRPDGGKLHLYINGEHQGTIVESRSATQDRAEVLQNLDLAQFKPVAGALRIELKAEGDGPVDITDIRLTRYKGVRVSNFGFIGAQVSILSRWSWPLVAEQIKSLDPALLILAFGTNEGHAPVGGIEQRYAGEFEKRLAALKAAAPRASFVVVGPPDANRYPRYCLPATAPKQPEQSAPSSNWPDAAATPSRLPDAGPASPPRPGDGEPATEPSTEPGSPVASARPPPKRPPPEPPADAVCQPLTVEERSTYDRLIEAKDRRLCRWHTPASIKSVRRIQREVAERHGALFFDWFELFESDCGADRWFRQGLAHKDRVHFKREGYWRAAERLHSRLLAGYVSPPTR